MVLLDYLCFRYPHSTTPTFVVCVETLTANKETSSRVLVGPIAPTPAVSSSITSFQIANVTHKASERSANNHILPRVSALVDVEPLLKCKFKHSN